MVGWSPCFESVVTWNSLVGRKVTDLKVARKLSEKLGTGFQYPFMVTSPSSGLTSLP